MPTHLRGALGSWRVRVESAQESHLWPLFIQPQTRYHGGCASEVELLKIEGILCIILYYYIGYLSL